MFVLESPQSPNTVFQIGDVNVDPQTGEVTRDGVTRRIEPRTMDVLILLVRHQGDVVSRDTLIEQVWRGALVSDDVISRCIYQLRKELGDAERSLIKTVPKRGYKLTTGVEVPAAATKTPAAEVASASSPTSVRRRGLLLAGALVALLGLAAFWLLNRPGADSAVTMEPLTLALAVTEADNEVSPSAGLLSYGLTEDLVQRLGGAPELTVLMESARAAVPHNEVLRLPDIDAELAVHVTDSGQQWTLEVSLTVGPNVAWSFTGDTARTPIDELLQELVDRTLVSLGRPVPDRPVVGFTTDELDAYRLLLYGRAQFQTRNAANIARALRYFEDAATMAPDFASAYVSIAEAHTLRYEYSAADWASVRDVARDAIQIARELAPGSAHVVAVDGYVKYADTEFGLAEASFLRAITMNPSYADAHMWLGRTYIQTGRMLRARDAFLATVRLVPARSRAVENLGLAYQAVGEYAESIKYFRFVAEREPDNFPAFWRLASAYWDHGKLDEALSAFEDAERTGAANGTFFSQYALVALDAGQIDRGVGLVRRARLSGETTLWTVRAMLAGALHTASTEGVVQEFEALLERYPVAPQIQLALAQAYMFAGRWQQAADIYRTRRAANDGTFYYHFDAYYGTSHALMLAIATQRLGEDPELMFAEARQHIASYDDDPIQAYGLTYLRASLRAVHGDRDGALSLFRQAHKEGWRHWWWLAVDPSWLDYRKDPEFMQVVADLKRSESDSAYSN